MAKKFNETLLDRRVIDKYIKKGVTTAEEYSEFLKSLPDESKNVDYIKAYVEEDSSLTFSSVEKVRN